jgi:IS4 transposase
VKIHLVLDHAGYLPCFAHITDGKVHDVTVGRTLRFAAGTIVVKDKGYVDYTWWKQMEEDGVYFVTRLKQDLKYTIIEQRPIPEQGKVRGDHLIEIAATAERPFQLVLRVVTIWEEKRQEELVFLTNQMSFAASTIGKIYKERWQIELFFKALKQLLRVKTFVGTSSNALHIQLWTALIAMLLLKFMQFRATAGLSLSNLVALLRQQLFVYRDLWQWLADPFQAPPALAGVDDQMALDF